MTSHRQKLFTGITFATVNLKMALVVVDVKVGGSTVAGGNDPDDLCRLRVVTEEIGRQVNAEG